MAADPSATAKSALDFAGQLLQQGRIEEGERWLAEVLVKFPEAAELWNMRGVFLLKSGRSAEALAALETATSLKPDLASAQLNRCHALITLGRAAEAAGIFRPLVAGDPYNPLYLQALSRALAAWGKPAEAAPLLRQVVTLQPNNIVAWIQLSETTEQVEGPAAAHAVFDQALASNPDSTPLVLARVACFRRALQLREADAYLEALAQRFPDAPWIPLHQANLIWDIDRTRGATLFRRVLALEPDNYNAHLGLIQCLSRDEALGEESDLAEAHRLSLLVLERTPPASTAARLLATASKLTRQVFIRTAAFDAMDRQGDFASLGRSWVQADNHTALLAHIGRVSSRADKLELIEQHRLWGRATEAAAARAPIRRSPRPPGERIRLGVLSSDLRRHVVALFARPIFDHIDRERFEVFAYSFANTGPDEVQARIAGQVDAFRLNPAMSARDAAQMIADDGIDFLVELGGSTNMNKLEVMAYRPAPIQASWLGYPHSTGLSTIDYFLCDAFNAPTAPDLLLERPLVIPGSWIALGPEFGDAHEIAQTPPSARNGHVTFGTANHPRKYSRDLLRLWARIVARTPGSRFMFVRPEGKTAAFRENVLAQFAAEGVGPERVVFQSTWGEVLPSYNEIDVALDTFPLTGGTTTADTVWMGVPVVSLAGEAFYERISASILHSAGLADLCVATTEEYEAKAVALALDEERRRTLRRTLRDTIRGSVLGQPELFARNFYDAIWKAVRG